MVGGGSRPPGFATILLGLLLLIGCFTPAPRLAGAPLVPPTGKSGASPAPESAGPTLRLDYGRGESPGNSVAEFMYFVPLISLEPVSVVKSPGNTQRARMVSATRSFTTSSFLVTCEFEFAGEGNQQNIFDHTDKIPGMSGSSRKAARSTINSVPSTLKGQAASASRWRER